MKHTPPKNWPPVSTMKQPTPVQSKTKNINMEIHKLPSMPQFSTHSINEDFKKEFLRLYATDNSFESMDAESVRIMFRLNIRHRIIPFHSFGLGINLKNDSVDLG